MPVPHTVRTLKQACLRNISKNMDRLWSADFDRLFADTPRLYYVLGPFDYMTSEMIQELLDTLCADHRVRRSHMHLLLTGRLKELDFSKCSNMTSMLHLVGIRCQKLTKLDLSNCSVASQTVLCSIFQSLPLLRWLNLRQTKTNDQVLTTILSSCKKLQHLNLFACPVTDRGITNIFKEPENGNSSSNMKQKNTCSTSGVSLTYLNISATKISSKGAVIILNMCPNLHVLLYADVIDAVAQISNSSDHEHNLKLRTLNASGLKCREVSPESVQLAVLRCPFVTEINFYQNANDSTLQYLKELKHLNTLEITSDQWGDVTFFDGLKPLFLSIGPNIRSLGLYDIKDLDIGQLGVLCPKLKRLKCVMAVFNSVAFIDTPLSGKDLRSIYRDLDNLMVVIGNDCTDFSASMFEQILENATGLSELHLINVQCMSSDLLLRIIAMHGMQSLSSLTLESCNRISGDAISRLIRCENPLCALCLRNCQDTTQQDVDGYRKYVKKHNLQLSIVWE
ncbi:uncharacterized protein LOC124274364 [Haliotis rubra]|uniref:uncharacterized protein LOC124274364 n=1 Tax=Haliotis rubra TaxID=36100 RepID=UPI001EE501E2|nr:uncharacterized protein LOC124274364 [Haliotis rubra]